MTDPPPPIPARLAAGAFLLVDKPRGPSSHQVTAWVRDLLGVERAGHAGTLDPNVSGLLWVGIGPALKLLPLVLEFPKRYVGAMEFHGEVAAAELARVVAEFQGPIYQTPPVRSAVRRERRIRTIHRLTVLEAHGTSALLEVVADSGTYVRTLAVDLGEALGLGGHLVELRRTGTGPFSESMAVSLAQIADARAAADQGDPAPLDRLLHPLAEVWKEFPQIALRSAAASAVAHGANLARGGILATSRAFSRGARVALIVPPETLIATGTALVDSADLGGSREGWVVDTDRVLADPAGFPLAWKRPDGQAPDAHVK